MYDVNQLHNTSMDLAEMAVIARMNKEHEKSDKLFLESLDYELKAIDQLEKTSPVEPTYSILLRSAATLALDCNKPRLAERLCGKALASDPPTEIAEELRDLLEQVNFKRHLLLRGISLGDDELQMSMAGESVGFGVVDSSEFLTRVETASKVLYRLAEKRRNLPFRERGPRKKDILENVEVFISVPRAASFAVTLKLGRPQTQMSLPDMGGGISAPDIVDEFMEIIDLVNRNEQKEIESCVPDQAYRNNLVNLVRKLAPDGDNVKVVGFTALRQGREKFIAVKKRDTIATKEVPKQLIEKLPVELEEAKEIPHRMEIHGFLHYADKTHGSHHIKLEDEKNNTTYDVKVPVGMMNDIVRPLWDMAVVVTGTMLGDVITLEDIKEEEE